MDSKQMPTTAQRHLRPADCPAYILAGGRSSRFGSDKARLRIDSQPLLLALRRCLIEQGHEVEVVADRPDRYDDLGIVCLVDRQANCGPLAAVATALADCQHRAKDWLLLLSCDLLVWQAAWFWQLSAAIEPTTVEASNSDCEVWQRPMDAVGYVSSRQGELRRWQPFPSLLHSRLLPQVIQQLDDGRSRSMQALLDHSRAAAIAADGATHPQAFSFNTAEELLAVKLLLLRVNEMS